MNRKKIPASELHSTPSALENVDFKSGQVYVGKGFLAFCNFPRLTQELHALDPLADVDQQGLEWQLESWVDVLATGREEYRLRLKVHAFFLMECQRCMSAYQDPIEVDSQFVLLPTEELVDAFPLENDVEDALLNSHSFNLMELIEEEVLLALPLVPKHPEGQCANSWLGDGQIQSSDELLTKSEEIDPVTGKKNPFLTLKKLKLNS